MILCEENHLIYNQFIIVNDNIMNKMKRNKMEKRRK